MRAAFCVAIVTAAGGCSLDDPPEVPSWQVDVMPVLAANCVRCHGYPQNQLVPAGSRFDAYGATIVPGQVLDPPPALNISGASALAADMAQRTEPSFRSNFIERMPPTRILDERSYRVLRNWAGSADVANNGVRGSGHADNRSPSIVMQEVGRTGAVITFTMEVDDLDHDLVSGNILGPVRSEAGVQALGVIGIVASGRRTVEWDTTGLTAGTYDLTARLDDGADIDGPDGSEDYIEVPVGQVVLP